MKCLNKHEELKKPLPDERYISQPDLLLMCKKQRDGDWEGQIPLWFVADCLQHVDGQNGRVIDLCGLKDTTWFSHGF